MSSCDRCIGPEKDFFIQSPTSLANDFQAVFGPDMPKAQTSWSDINYPLTFVQINIFEEPQNIFSTKIPDPKLSSQPPVFFTIECPPLGMENSFGFCTTIFGKASWDLQLSGAPTVVESTSGCLGYLQLSKAPTVVRSIERTYSCLDYLQLSRASSVVESTFSYPIYPQLSRAPPLVQSTSSCREHLQLSKVSLVVESTSSCPKYLKLSRVPPVVQSISSCPEHLQLSKVSPVIDNVSSYREYPQLSRVPPLVQSTSSCREWFLSDRERHTFVHVHRCPSSSPIQSRPSVIVSHGSSKAGQGNNQDWKGPGQSDDWILSHRQSLFWLDLHM